MLLIQTSDTDVFVLLMYYLDMLHSNGLCKLWMKAGSDDSTRYIPIHILTSRVGVDLCQVLPVEYTLIGCDPTGKCGTKSAALYINPISYLKDFGIIGQGLQEVVIESAENYSAQALNNGKKCFAMDQL